MLTATELMVQSRMTAHDNLNHARADIDSLFGSGYAVAHPELMAAYLNAAALDFIASWCTQELASRLDNIASALDGPRNE